MPLSPEGEQRMASSQLGTGGIPSLLLPVGAAGRAGRDGSEGMALRLLGRAGSAGMALRVACAGSSGIASDALASGSSFAAACSPSRAGWEAVMLLLLGACLPSASSAARCSMACTSMGNCGASWLLDGSGWPLVCAASS